jgi:eukaryotic translation initiation factor 2C
MSRRGGGRQPDSRRDQPSPAAYQGGGRGRGGGGGRGGRGGEGGGGRGRGGSSSYSAPPPAQASFPQMPRPAAPRPAAPLQTAPPPAASPTGPPPTAPASSHSSASSSSAPPPVSASTPVDALNREIQKLTLQPSAPPSSSKALGFPKRPGYGKIGSKIVVRANHFLVEVADKDLHHYDVSSFSNFFFSKNKYKIGHMYLG